MSIIVKAPNKIPDHICNSLFLAGSIEMGKAIAWQSYVQTELRDEDVLIMNPRRNDWNSSWKQDIKNKKFKQQVDWELDCLGTAEIIFMYFDPKTKSPITLLELGLLAGCCDSLIVCCPEGYCRKGNVDIICKRYGIQTVKNIDAGIKAIKCYLH